MIYLNGYSYVSNYNSSSVSVIAGTTNKVVSNITVGLDPIGAVFDSLNGYIYVTKGNSFNVSSQTSPYCGSLSVINSSTNSVVSTVNLGSDPIGSTFDSENGYIYVSISDTGEICIINGSTNCVISDIQVGVNSYGVAFDSSNGYPYVTNFGSGSVSIIYIESPFKSPGPPDLGTYALIGGVVATAGILTTVVLIRRRKSTP